jgi:DNA-binding Xre family transcriptional regulator
MDFEKIIELMRDRRINLSEVSRKTGLSRFTLHKIVNGTQKTIKIENLKKLEVYFNGINSTALS